MKKTKVKYGYLREHTDDADGYDESTGLSRTGLDVYLKAIFPNEVFIHDQAIGGDCKHPRKRPDYRCENLKLIVEFDGLPHYKKPESYFNDKQSNSFYEYLGYKVIRIPYFIQLTNEVVKQLFGISVKEKLFDVKYPSLTYGCTPATLCPLGVQRMAEEFTKFPEQYKINMDYMKSLPKSESYRIGYEFLEREYMRIKKLDSK